MFGIFSIQNILSRARMHGMKKYKNVLIVVALVVVFGALLTTTSAMRTSGNLIFVPNTGVACLPNGHQQLALHIHPKLSITVDGVPETIPANIGVSPTCMAELHTHDATGVIHLETATADRFSQLSFADFFAVWGVPIQREGYALSITVDGVSVATPGDVPLKDGSFIVMSYTTQ